MPTLEISPDLKINYQDVNPTGSQPVLLLHGLGSTSGSWAFQYPALQAAGCRAIAADLRGFGASTYPGGEFRIKDLAEDMRILLDSLSLEKVSVVGISMGGIVAQQLALDYPEIVQKLVLVNTFASLKPDNLSQFFYFYFRLIMVHTLGVSAQANAVAARIFPKPDHAEFRRKLLEEIQSADPRAYRGALRSLAKFDVLAKLNQISVPALVVTSSGDTTVHPDRQKQLAQHLPDARQVMIPDANHAVIIDQPAEFNRALLAFLLNA